MAAVLSCEKDLKFYVIGQKRFKSTREQVTVYLQLVLYRAYESE